MDRRVTCPLPEAFLNNMRNMLGDEYPAFLRALDMPPALALRLNPRREGAEAAAVRVAVDRDREPHAAELPFGRFCPGKGF